MKKAIIQKQDTDIQPDPNAPMLAAMILARVGERLWREGILTIPGYPNPKKDVNDKQE